MIESWLPIGYCLADGSELQLPLFEGRDWQIVATREQGRVLIVLESLACRWWMAGLLREDDLAGFEYGSQCFYALSANSGPALYQVNRSKSPDSKIEALAFAAAYKATREIDVSSSLHDAIYVKQLERLLPVYTSEACVEDAVMLGCWLTGGARVSVNNTARLQKALTWLDAEHLADVIASAGFNTAASLIIAKTEEPDIQEHAKSQREDISFSVHESAFNRCVADSTPFLLAGRPELAAFFNEHIIDIIRHRVQYARMGIEFPAPIVLHGPPGCGKTYAVEKLIDYLGWPSFQVDASSVASPYIHDTSKKIAEVFDKAEIQAPSVVVIDEMDAFLADRQSGGEQHRVEEVAEFLRRIPLAQKKQVLIIAMTNRIDSIDPAILRRGRFDHIMKVDFANAEEILALLESLLEALPKEENLDLQSLATKMAFRPLSDVSFVVREAARMAARAGQACLTQDNLNIASETTASRSAAESASKRIGFI